jgi:C4-dicarboxylate-specific signal transduction histidine kinase
MEAANPLLNIRQSLHALAQPLAAVTGLVDLLLLEMDEEEEVFQEIKLISDQLEKVLLIIEEMRRIAREATAREGVVILDVAPLAEST